MFVKRLKEASMKIWVNNKTFGEHLWSFMYNAGDKARVTVLPECNMNKMNGVWPLILDVDPERWYAWPDFVESLSCLQGNNKDGVMSILKIECTAAEYAMIVENASGDDEWVESLNCVLTDAP